MQTFCCFSELRILGSLHPQRSSDRLQAHGHPNPAASDCHEEVYAQTSGTRGGLVHPPFSCQPCGQGSKPHRSSACTCLLRYSLNPEPANLQRPGEIGPARPPASSPNWPPLWPAAHSQPCTGAVHACPAQRSRLCLWTTTARLFPDGSGRIPRTPSRSTPSRRLNSQET